ncbi:SpoIIE family protein phosphatase [Lachnospiraceae bacterium MD335]|nr:SpoIIE family protein phosphatase [Lachnospiraceae bacterium MD335]
MRKQNSTFQSAFISESGSELQNNDYFAFVELEEYACYVVADGLNDLPDTESAKLAIETALLSFQEHPSMRKNALLSYIKAANRALCKADQKERLKASVMIVVTNYEAFRYVYAGNTRLRLYRNGNKKEQSRDTSLSSDLGKEKNLSEDMLAKHEERNNLYAYVGQGDRFKPVVSKKIKLENGDILALYTRGIWENLDGGELDDVFSEAKDDPKESLNDAEELLLSKQPKTLENYTFATIFVDKVFTDPERKKKRKKIAIICIAAVVIILAVSAVIWFLHRRYIRLVEDMDRRYADTIEYIQDSNFIRAGEEAKEALADAEKLRNKEYIQKISDYIKLIEAVNKADEAYDGGNYEEAQNSYISARTRSRYADHAADDYINQKLEHIADYLSVFDYIRLGDALNEQGDYDKAEEKYLQAKQLATGVYYEEGRKEAISALEDLYQNRQEEAESVKQKAQEQAEIEVSAAQLAVEGDKAFAEGDYDSASAFYAMAIEKYQELGDDVHVVLIQTKLDSCRLKAEEIKEKEQQAQDYVNDGKQQADDGNYVEAKKQYLLAKNIYKELGMDDKAEELDGLMEILAVELEQEDMEQSSTNETLDGILQE